MLDYQINSQIFEAYQKVKSCRKQKPVNEAGFLLPFLKAAGRWALGQGTKAAAAYGIDKAGDEIGDMLEKRGHGKAAYLTRTAAPVAAFYRSPLYGWSNFGNEAVDELKQIDAQQKERQKETLVSDGQNINQEFLNYVSKPVSCPIKGCNHVAKSQLELNTHYMSDHGLSAEEVEGSKEDVKNSNEEDDESENLVSCPYGKGCKWIGIQSQMDSHYRESHPDYFDDEE